MTVRPAPQLRDYQRGLIEQVRAVLRTDRRVVLQSPTGSGKTVLTAHMIRAAADRGMRSWFVVHRKELLRQTSGALWSLGVQHGVIASGRTPTPDQVQVATIQTLARRAAALPPPAFIIIDEAHHTAAASYLEVLGHCPRSFVVGLTATPERADGRGLDDIFSAIVLGPTVSWLTEKGFLAPYRIIAPPRAVDVTGVHSRAGDFVRGELEAVVDQTAVVGDAVEHYRRHVAPASCLVYCVSRAHAHHVEEAYRAGGIDARYCAGDTDAGERDRIIEGFRRGRPPVIVSVDLFGEGLDVPGLTAVQLLRPTQSLGLHLQQVGRALRHEPGKTALILDHVGNSWRHGLPDDEREWTLEGRRRRRGPVEDSGPALLHCPSCFAIYRAQLRTCPACGFTPQLQFRDLPDQVDGELAEIDPEQHRRMRAREEGRARTAEALVALARDRGYKPAWVVHRIIARAKRERGEDLEFGDVMREVRQLWAAQPAGASA